MYNDVYSVWLSVVPYNEDRDLTDDEFMFLGSSASFPVSMTYSSSTTGIIGQTPDTAIFVDGAQGAVMNMNISTERVNPVNYISTTTTPPKDARIGDTYRIGPTKTHYITIDKKMYAETTFITWDGEKWIPTDSYAPLYSNRKFLEKLLECRTSIQMMNNAYVLRIYNIEQTPKSTYSNLYNLEQFRNNSKPKELYVFLNRYDYTLNMDAPNELSMTYEFVLRNRLKGYNE